MTQTAEENKGGWMRAVGLLRNFWVNMAAIGIGVAIGLFSKETAKNLIPFGKIYLTLLSMTVLPIIFSAIANSLGQMLRIGTARKYIGRLIVVFAVAVLLAGFVGVIGGVLGKPGVGLDSSTQHMLGKLLIVSQPTQKAVTKEATGLFEFLHLMVPVNILRAFTRDQSLAVVFVSILLGIAMGTSRSEASGRLLDVMRGVYESFFKILNWALYGLPFGLCCLVAGQASQIGTEYLYTVGRIILLFYLCCLLLCLVYVIAIRFATGVSVLNILRALRDPLTLAFVASNSLVAMPGALRHLEEQLGQPAQVGEFVVPLGISMNRHAYPVLFALISVFLAQIYHQPLGVLALCQIAVTSSLVGMAAIGPAASVAPMIAMIAAPFGFPAGLGVAILVETTALVTPMVAMTHLLGSCATSTLISMERPK